MRPRKPSRRLHEQNQRLRAENKHMRNQISIALQCLGDTVEYDQAANQAAAHLAAALGAIPLPPPRSTPFDNDPNEVF